MKKMLALALVLTMLATGILPLAVQASTASVYYDDQLLIAPGTAKVAEDEDNGIPVYFKDEPMVFTAASVEIDGTVFVPLRQFGEQIGAEVQWNFNTEEAAIIYEGTAVKVKEGASVATVSGTEVAISQTVRKLDNLLFVPVRFLAENLGWNVSWDEAESAVKITKKSAEATVLEDQGNWYQVVSVTASEDDGNVPVNVLDGNYDTRWSAESNGAYITLELEEVKPVAYLGFAGYQGDTRMSYISVQLSEDGENWTEVVTRLETEPTLAMRPVDFGGVYNAKYVRVLGYGNTTNAWNSYTELKVYGTSEDGSMPVDPNGPLATAIDINVLSPELQEALKKLDEDYYSRLDVYIANLYDHEQKGFYMTISGRDDPEQDTAIEMSAWAQGILTNFDGYMYFPDEVKQDWIQYYFDRQDPETGYFIDTQGPTNARETNRNQAAAIGRLSAWGVKEYPYLHPDQVADASSGNTEVAADSALRPDYVDTVDSYMAWIESWNWETNSWTAGDQTHQSLAYLTRYTGDKYQDYIDALLSWLDERFQRFGNGTWAPEVNFNSISGVFKVAAALADLNQKLPNPELILEACIECAKTDTPTASMHLQNLLSVYGRIRSQYPELSDAVTEAVLESMPQFMEWIGKFYAPDGGFSMYEGKSQGTFGGVAGSHQKWEGDIDSVKMFVNVRNSLYTTVGATATKLHMHEDFWDWITGAKETPSPYLDPVYETPPTGASGAVLVDFQEFTGGTKLEGSYENITWTSGIDLEVVDDKDRRDNRVLAVTKSTENTNMTATLNLGTLYDRVRYTPPKTNQTEVLEYDLKFEDCTAGNNFWISCGVNKSNGYMLNFGGKGNQKVGVKISDSDVNHGGTFYTLEPGNWYRIRVEAYHGESAEDYKAKVYIDGELVATNNYSYNYNGGTAPGSIKPELTLAWYKAGYGRVYLDNVTSFTKQ